MKVYVNAGFGECLDSATLAWIRDHGFRGIRQEIFRGQDAEPIIRELFESDLEAILLLGGGKMERISFDHTVELARHVALVARDVIGIEPARLAVEIGNEPDLAIDQYKRDPGEFARLVTACAAAIWQVVPSMSVLCGGVSNTHKDGLQYLERASRAGFPDGCQIGYHSYHTTVTPLTPHSGFRSRQEEFDQLNAICAGRPKWCTEVGWHTFPSDVRSGISRRRVQFNDEQVADFTEQELRLHRAAGSICAALFQLNDGEPALSHEHRYGMRRVDGTPKPVAARIHRISQELA
jgi:hypothetical protein